ncbi:MAG: hypothetical protein L0I62_06705 [Gammaproteobacteria bacterium]|nr:hypothetical protein [Gammaproteobacteria bacterium]
MKSGTVIILCALILAACTGKNETASDSDPGAPATASAAVAAPASSANLTQVKQVVERFGKRLRQVSTLAPPDDLRQTLRKNYGELVTDQLLQTWLADPHSAPGRRVSSPWPQDIHIAQVRCGTASRCEVQGEVRYVTSEELAHGGVFATRSIRLALQKSAGRWLINRIRMGKLTPVQTPAPRSGASR